MRSRPSRLLVTRPASESTSRCLVMAWRDTSKRLLRRVSEAGPLAQRLTIRPRRVASPSAAKSGAASLSFAAESASAFDMALDVDELALPAALVHAEGLVAAPRRQLVEAGFHNLQPGAALRGLQPELHQGHGLLGVVAGRVHGAGMPAIGE